MKRKVLEKAYALGLRKKGHSYNEILKRVPASKSTLSKWLRDADLSAEEMERVREHTGGNRSAGRAKVAASARTRKESRDAEIEEVVAELYAASRGEPLFHAGLALYWANGTKTGSSFQIASSDPRLLNLMLDWAARYLSVPRESIRLRLYAHTDGFREVWSRELGVSPSSFQKTVLKTAGKRLSADPGYKGSVRIEISSGMPAQKMRVLINLFLDDYQKPSTV